MNGTLPVSTGARFGAGVEVLAPESVRDHVRRELRKAADAYDG